MARRGLHGSEHNVLKEISREQVAQLQCVFTVLDQDTDGLLSKEEAISAAEMLSSPLKPMQSVRDDEKVSFDHFLKLMTKGANLDLQLTPFQAAVNQFFSSLDQEGKGYITRHQLQRFFSEAGVKTQPGLVRSLVEHLDTSLNGESFTREEITAFLQLRLEKDEFILH